jgi:hypothetical protein
MVSGQHPKVTTIAINELFPTQMTVGMREVNIKRKRWRNAETDETREKIISSHTIPVVFGPNDRRYLIDRHHFTRALCDEGIKNLEVATVDDLSIFDENELWALLGHRGWMYPFDDAGQQYKYTAIPKSLEELTDDPFRSLASALRRAGGYHKSAMPFSEFRWADFLRVRVDRALVEDDFDDAARLALNLAKSADAAGLPGWLGH